ncbi:MAG: Flp pilus assembly protein CpaB [Pirellulaceae bacterium]
MRPKTLILFIVAIGCGLVASIGVSQYMEQAKGVVAVVDTAKIYVATTEVSPGEKLDAKNVSLEEWPRDRIPEGAISDLKELENKFSRTRMYKGEPILMAKVSDTMDGNVAQSIPDGYRVVAIKVDENSNAGGLVRPGDRVDLVLFLRKSTDIPETGTKTILRDVNVFAVGGQVEREMDKQGGSRDVRTVSLLVTPRQADTVMLAKELGVLSLSLRRPNDSSQEISEGETVQSLFGRDGEDANEKKKKTDGEDPAAQWASDPAPPPAMPVIQPPVVVEPPPPPAFTMKIRTNNGDHTFVFQNMDSAPQELDAGLPLDQPAPSVGATNAQPPLPFPGNGPANGSQYEVTDEESRPDEAPAPVDEDSPPEEKVDEEGR